MKSNKIIKIFTVSVKHENAQVDIPNLLDKLADEVAKLKYDQILDIVFNTEMVEAGFVSKFTVYYTE